MAISFDDGPDPEWTPKILDVLKKYNVKGTFFMIGEVAQDNVGVMQRVYREGHEIGNHTFTHPGYLRRSRNTQVDLQLNLTERLFAAKLGVQPLYFRPPYSIDQEPDTNDQAAPIDRIQSLGLRHRRRQDRHERLGRASAQDAAGDHRQRLPADSTWTQTKTWMRGSIILMHDGGGDRSATVAALPVLITALARHGLRVRAGVGADGQDIARM